MRKLFCIGIAGAFVLGLMAQPQQITVPTNYPQIITRIPPANQPFSLAQAVLTVQNEALAAQSGVATLRTQTGQALGTRDQQIQALQQVGTTLDQRIKLLEQADPTREQRISALEKANGPIVQHINTLEGQNLKSQVDDLKNQLIELRTATCPLLKNGKVKDVDKAQVDKLCTSESAEAK